jgi:hypothetical protein
VAALAARRQGAPRGSIESMLKTLQYAKHKIRTANGVSTKHYGGCNTIPLQGLGQGNGFAPTGWGVISTPLTSMMRNAAYGFETLTCLSNKLLAFVCYPFVNDTDLAHNRKSIHTKGEDFLQEMQGFMQHWEGGLRATGGALRMDKSFWYLIDFEWKNNKWQYRSICDMPGNISVRDFVTE